MNTQEIAAIVQEMRTRPNEYEPQLIRDGNTAESVVGWIKRLADRLEQAVVTKCVILLDTDEGFRSFDVKDATTALNVLLAQEWNDSQVVCLAIAIPHATGYAVIQNDGSWQWHCNQWFMK